MEYQLSLTEGDLRLMKPSKSLSGSLSKSKTTIIRIGSIPIAISIPKIHLKSIKAFTIAIDRKNAITERNDLEAGDVHK
jgi:hypothetical protein